jgi:hypothetical protein
VLSFFWARAKARANTIIQVHHVKFMNLGFFHKDQRSSCKYDQKTTGYDNKYEVILPKFLCLGQMQSFATKRDFLCLLSVPPPL